MEFFKIVVKRPPFKDIIEHHEVSSAAEPEFVSRVTHYTSLLNVQSTRVERINQAAYIRATRPEE